jgi:hypothetical protein
MTDFEIHTACPIKKRVMFDWPRCSKLSACIIFVRFTGDCGKRRKGHRHHNSHVNSSVNKSIEEELIAKLSENYGRNNCASVPLMLFMLSLIDAGVGAKAKFAVAVLMSVRFKTLAAYLFF